MPLLSAVVQPLLAQAPAAPAGFMSSQLIMMVLIMGALYFFMIAPQRKKQKEHEKMMKALGPGDEIVTSGGIYGTVTAVKEDRFIIRVADTTKIEIGKSFVHAVLKKSEKTEKLVEEKK